MRDARLSKDFGDVCREAIPFAGLYFRLKSETGVAG